MAEKYPYIAECLRILTPKSRFSVVNECLEGIVWFDDNPEERPSDDEIKTEHVKQAAIAAKLTHQPDRHKAYPHVRDQLDMLYKDIDSGKLDKTGDWYKAIKKVKDDIPKPE